MRAWKIVRVAVAASLVPLAPANGEPPASGARPAREPAGAREVSLRPRFEPGRETRYRLELSSRNQLKTDATPDISGDQTLSQTILLRLRTVEAGEGGATVELIYDAIRASMETADFKAQFDSAAPGVRSPKPGGNSPPPARSATDRDMDELLAQIMQPMVGTKLTMKLDAAGNITSVTGGQELTGGGLSSLLSGVLGGMGLGHAGASGLVPTPSGGGPLNWLISGPGQKATVRIGESWTNRDTLSGTPIGGVAMVTRHTCRSASGGVVRCSFTGQADAASTDHGFADAGLGFQLRSARYGGDYAWDSDRGELAEFSSNLTSEIDQGSPADRVSLARPPA